MRKLLLLTLVGLLLFIPDSYALNLSRVKTWSASEILTASDLNAEFDNILNHDIANADISASAAIVASKIDFTTASAIGSTTPSTGAFTTLSATGAIAANGDSITCDGVLVINATSATSFNDENITNVGDIKIDTLSADDGSSFAMGNNWTSAGKTVADLGTVTTCDINGGSIDGVTIGAASAPTTTDIGTVAAGTWQGTAVATTYGGSGLTTATITTFTYTGDGNSTQAVTGFNFQPKGVMFWRTGTTRQNADTGPFCKSDKDGIYAQHIAQDGTGGIVDDDIVISLDADGITVGDGTSAPRGGANVSSAGYGGIAWTF